MERHSGDVGRGIEKAVQPRFARAQSVARGRCAKIDEVQFQQLCGLSLRGIEAVQVRGNRAAPRLHDLPAAEYVHAYLLLSRREQFRVPDQHDPCVRRVVAHIRDHLTDGVGVGLTRDVPIVGEPSLVGGLRSAAVGKVEHAGLQRRDQPRRVGRGPGIVHPGLNSDDLRLRPECLLFGGLGHLVYQPPAFPRSDRGPTARGIHEVPRAREPHPLAQPSRPGCGPVQALFACRDQLRIVRGERITERHQGFTLGSVAFNRRRRGRCIHDGRGERSGRHGAEGSASTPKKLAGQGLSYPVSSQRADRNQAR